VEFFPEEGKYHYTGHRNCKIRHSPSESDKLGFTCPKCQRKLTIGVMHRVSELAEQSRSEDYIPKNRPPFKRLVPLFEILAEVFNVQSTSQKVIDEYNNLVNRFGSELGILLKTPLEDLERGLSIYKIVEGIGRVRRGNIVVDPGYDGVYGTVKIWNFDSEPTRRNSLVNQKLPEGQAGLFD